MQARFLDLGTLAPQALHAAYHGLALAQDEGARPILAWARSAAAHVCIGQTQSAPEELDLEACAQAQVAVVRRTLGGGTVLLDDEQRCVFFILPLTLAAARPQRIFRYCLDPLARTYRSFGIDARQVGRADLWVSDAKIAGSGAATLGHSIVFASSFILRFPEALFCRLVRAPSPEFRAWLGAALPCAFTSWARVGAVPDDAILVQILRAAVAADLGWDLEPDLPSAQERHAMHEAEEELQADDASGDAVEERRRIRNGIKINARTFLVESRDGDDWLRVLLANGRIARIDTHDAVAAAALERCVGRSARFADLEDGLGRVLTPSAARHWARRVELCLTGAGADDAAAEND